MAAKKARRRPVFHKPEVWALARDLYLEGVCAADVEDRVGVRVDALRRRARLEGWTRKKVWGAGADPASPTEPDDRPIGAPSTDGPPDTVRQLEELGSVRLAETTLLRAWEAIQGGRAGEALTLTKAAHELATFAEMLVILKKNRAEDEKRFPEGEAPPWGSPIRS